MYHAADVTDPALTAYQLPELPAAAPKGDRSTRQLVLFRHNREGILLGEPVSDADARRYCSRPDCHGNGWFVAPVRIPYSLGDETSQP
jgi:hypothetical protein